MPELNPDVNVDDEDAWDFSYLTESPSWAFDSSSLLWGPQKNESFIALAASSFVTTTGLTYRIAIDVTDYDGDGSTKPQLRVWIGWNNSPIVFNLNGRPDSFTLMEKAVADNTGRGTTDPAVWIELRTDLPPISQGHVAGNVTFRIQRVSIFLQTPYTGDFRNVHNTTLNALRERQRKFVQAENAAVTYTVNWVPLLNTDTVYTSIWTSEDSGLTITNEASSPTTTSARLSGDVGRYRAVNQVTTVAGDTFERYIDVVINDNSSGYSSDYGLVR